MTVEFITSIIQGLTEGFGSPALVFLILGIMLFAIVSFVLKVSPIFSFLFVIMFIIVAVINVGAPIAWGWAIIVIILAAAAFFVFKELFLR